MKNKILSLGLAALCLATLAACNNGNKTNSQQTSTVTEAKHTKITIWATAKEEAVVKAVTDAYNKEHPDNPYTYDYKPVSEGDCGSTLGKDPTVEGAPALFLIADDQIASLVSKNIVSEIRGTRKDAVLNSTNAAAIEGATYDDKLYGYPVTADNGYFLYYDKSVISDAQAGSLEDILAAAKAANKSFYMDINNSYYQNSFLMSPEACGLNSLAWHNDADGKIYYDVTWDSDTGASVSQYIGGLVSSNYKDGTIKIGGNDVVTSGFQDGKVVAAVSGTWLEGDLKAAIGDNLAAAKLPSYHIGDKAYQMASFSGSKLYCLNKTRPVEEQRTAADLAALLTNKESQLVRFETRQSIPCNLDAAADARYTKHGTIGSIALAQQSNYAAPQSKACEDRYWALTTIGQAYLDGTYTTKEEWATFLKAQLDTLRVHQ